MQLHAMFTTARSPDGAARRRRPATGGRLPLATFRQLTKGWCGRPGEPQPRTAGDRAQPSDRLAAPHDAGGLQLVGSPIDRRQPQSAAGRLAAWPGTGAGPAW
jgi:hypothetical protein